MNCQDHVFEEPHDVEFDESLVIYQPCEYVEILGSTHSERWDETFYNEGAECEATQTTYYELDMVAIRDEVIDVPVPEGSRREEDVLMELERIIEEETEPWDMVFDPHQDTIEMEVFYEGEEYAVVFEKTDQEISV